MTQEIELWEILVPCIFQDNKKPIRLKHHKVWDDYVRKISKGQTILQPAKGFWLNPKSNELIQERMIPVRITATEKEIRKIIDFTISHYRQEAVLAYRISNKVLLIHKS